MAPEHVADPVLKRMGKPENKVYMQFVEKFNRINEKLGMKQYLVPYLMSSHPGSGLKEAVALAEHIRDLGYMPEQVQDFYPTPIHYFHLYVLYRSGSRNNGKSLCSNEAA